jgi:hypothetical protein
MTQLAFVTSKEEQERFESSPPFPGGRPPTRRECYEYVKHNYSYCWGEEKIVAHAKACFIGNYVYYVNFNGWDKPPDWVEGDPVIPEACPKKPFPAGSQSAQAVEVYRLMNLQKGA